MSEWLDNLIPLKVPPLEHEQLAGWRPTRKAAEGLGCRLLADQRIEVEPGVSLSADVYIPRAPGRYPAIVQCAAYTRELHTAGVPTGSNEIGCPPVFTDRGYAQVVAMRRGMGRSDGEAGVFLNSQDVDDLERCIAWAAAQPWCDGRVVMFGTSYYGMTQPLVAVRRPEALKAFFCNEICTDYFRHLLNFGGVFNLFFCNLWMGANFTPALFSLRVPPVVRALLSHVTNSPLKRFWQPFLMRRADALFRSFMAKTPAKPVREWYANWMLDAKSRETSTLAPGPSKDLGQIDIPFVVVQNLGYFNLHQFGAYDLFQNAATPSDRKWMILAPPRYELPVYAWQYEALAFFDHVLHDADNGYASQPPVRYWLEGAERFEGAANFPVPGAVARRFFLAPNGPDTATHLLTETAPENGGESRWAAVPLGLPLLGGFDEVANQILTFELPIERATRLAGPVSLHLSFSSNEIDSYVVARVGRVAADGGYHLLSLGAMSPARRLRDSARDTACEIVHDTSAPMPLEPGVPVDLAFSLTPGPTELRPGDRLRLDLASRLDLLRSNVSNGYVHFDLPGPPYLARNTLHYGAGSYLTLQETPAI
ncbi:CocE/NonD family hydrolase [Methylocystis sp. JR02]|uniref:CocE/NonD family hydrolase n=1 Tax=Methylocystis sp. JR02 TaxID=3046284 RepID=UPI0024BAC829|nr:CocE/NonD family hydrolase [Methylocystis sp. JR02]MDJ0447035.1 CocE/NonD family hydrolase [Methylocystis sp. JR02]